MTLESRNLSKLWFLPKSTLVWGYVCLAAVVLQWVTSGFVAQYVFTELDYRCTVTQTVYTLCFYSVLLVPHAVRHYRQTLVADSEDLSPVSFVLANKGKVMALGCLWLCAQVIYVMSLMYTSMGTNTAVSSSSSAFSFIFSMLILKYEFRWLSALGVAVTVSGVILTALFRAEKPTVAPDLEPTDQFDIKETVEGILMAVSAAACFGLFSCLFKKWVTEDRFGGIVFGSFGIVSFVIGIPFILIANYSGLQEFGLPDWRVALIVTADAIMCCFVNNVCLSRAFIYLTPVIVLVGLTMTTPLSIFGDAVIFANHSYSPLNIVGISLITLAVLVVGYDQAQFEKSLDQRKVEPEARIEDVKETATADSMPSPTLTAVQ